MTSGDDDDVRRREFVVEGIRLVEDPRLKRIRDGYSCSGAGQTPSDAATARAAPMRCCSRVMVGQLATMMFGDGQGGYARVSIFAVLDNYCLKP